MLSWPRRSSQPGWIGCAPAGEALLFALVERREGERARVHWVERAAGAELRGALRRLKRQHGAPRHDRVLVLERGAYQCLPLDAPADVPREDWAAAVRWQLKDMVDFGVDEAAVDVLAVPPGASNRTQPQLIAVAAPFERLRPLVDPARDAGLPWQAIDIRETALRNVSALVEPAGRAQALLHIDESHGTLVVTHGGELLTTRQFELTESALAQPDEGARQAAYDRAGLELQRTLDGFERQFSQVSLARLLVSPMAGVDAFCDHLRELLYVPVAALDLAEVLDLAAVPPLAEPAQLHAHLCAIGAALREGPA